MMAKELEDYEEVLSIIDFNLITEDNFGIPNSSKRIANVIGSLDHNLEEQNLIHTQNLNRNENDHDNSVLDASWLLESLKFDGDDLEADYFKEFEQFKQTLEVNCDKDSAKGSFILDPKIGGATTDTQNVVSMLETSTYIKNSYSARNADKNDAFCLPSIKHVDELSNLSIHSEVYDNRYGSKKVGRINPFEQLDIEISDSDDYAEEMNRCQRFIHNSVLDISDSKRVELSQLTLKLKKSYQFEVTHQLRFGEVRKDFIDTSSLNFHHQTVEKGQSPKLKTPVDANHNTIKTHQALTQSRVNFPAVRAYSHDLPEAFADNLITSTMTKTCADIKLSNSIINKKNKLASFSLKSADCINQDKTTDSKLNSSPIKFLPVNDVISRQNTAATEKSSKTLKFSNKSWVNPKHGPCKQSTNKLPVNNFMYEIYSSNKKYDTKLPKNEDRNDLKTRPTDTRQLDKFSFKDLAGTTATLDGLPIKRNSKMSKNDLIFTQQIKAVNQRGAALGIRRKMNTRSCANQTLVKRQSVHYKHLGKINLHYKTIIKELKTANHQLSQRLSDALKANLELSLITREKALAKLIKGQPQIFQLVINPGGITYPYSSIKDSIY